jgi:hypothetical protein
MLRNRAKSALFFKKDTASHLQSQGAKNNSIIVNKVTNYPCNGKIKMGSNVEVGNKFYIFVIQI